MVEDFGYIGCVFSRYIPPFGHIVASPFLYFAGRRIICIFAFDMTRLIQLSLSRFIRLLAMAVALALASGSIGAAGDGDTPSAIPEVTVPAGLSDKALADWLRSEFSPLAEAPLTSSPVWQTPAEAILRFVPAEWCGGTEQSDLYNAIATTSEMAAETRGLPPGNVGHITASGAGWAAGTAVFEGISTMLWQPAPDRRGDLARRMMYMAVIHPRELWTARGAMFFADGFWPLLTPFAAATMLEWHRADLPDDVERAETAAIAGAQGNYNPFVARPDLAEYLWGTLAGRPTPGGETDSSEPAPTPLKATYSLATDKYLDLVSPYVPADAVWRIDGRAVSVSRIPLEPLGAGSHHLDFISSARRGSVIITVRP